MNYKAWLLIALLLITVTVSGCLRKGEVEEVESENESIAENFSGSLDELFKKGETVMCTFGTSDQAGSMTGVVYVDGTRSRQDLIVNVTEEQTTENHVIIDNEWMYSWNSMQPGQGTKMNYQAMMDSVEDVEETDTAEEINYQRPDQNFDFQCDVWDVDESVFALPEDIEFVDFTEKMKEMTEAAADLNSKLENGDIPDMEALDDMMDNLQ